MKKYIILIVIALILAIGASFVFKNKNTKVINSDTIIEGDFQVSKDETLYLNKNAKLIIKGDFNLQGKIKSEQDINLVVEGNIDFSDNAQIVYRGNIFVTDNIDTLNQFISNSDQVFEDAGKVPESGNYLGPFTMGEGGDVIMKNINKKEDKDKTSSLFDKILAITPKALAQSDMPTKVVNLSGIVFPYALDKTNAKSRIIIFYFPQGKTKVNIKDLTVSAPVPPNGDHDYEKSCTAKGGNGYKGLRTTLKAWDIDIRNATFELANGGNGGGAKTKDGCKNPKAYGGNGAEAGNLKIVAEKSITISGLLKIVPGLAGSGGEAVAVAKDAEKGEKGNNAFAQGGRGADNKSFLSGYGNIKGTSNIEVGKIVAGSGGSALAKAGRGGDGKSCGQNGFDGGEVKAIGGDGGDAYVYSIPFFNQTQGGDGGFAEGIPGSGGNGQDSCDPLKPGGDGGNVSIIVGINIPGKGGKGDIPGKDGGVNKNMSNFYQIDNKVKGGDGGDGCPEGKGGSGGLEGEDGKDGKNTCPEVQNDENLFPDDSVSTKKTAKCKMPLDDILYSFPEDGGYTYKLISDNAIQITRDICVSKSESSLIRDIRSWTDTWPLGQNNICPKIEIKDVSFTSLASPCTFTLEFSQ